MLFFTSSKYESILLLVDSVMTILLYSFFRNVVLPLLIFFLQRHIFEITTTVCLNLQADRVNRESEVVESDSSDVKTQAEELYEEIIRSAVESANGE